MRFADLDLARRIETAESAAARKCARAQPRKKGGAAVLEVAGGWAVFTRVGSPISQAVGLGLHGPVKEAEIEKMEKFYRRRNSAVNIELCPLAHPSLVKVLGRRGYRPIELTNVLVRRLKRREKFAAPARGVAVRRAKPSEADLWARTVAQGFAEHFPVTPELIGVLRSFAKRAGTVSFFGLVGGKIAGGAVVYLKRKLAALGGASTLPEFRSRGVQTALQNARLKFAAAKGCELAITMTQPGSTSQRNAERRGFHIVYTRMKVIREWKKGNHRRA